MKRICMVAILLAVLCAAALPAGGRQAGGRQAAAGGSGDGADVLRVVTVNFPAYDFVRAVAGGAGGGGNDQKIEIRMLLPPGAESHAYEPTPRDIIDIQRCRVFIYTGGESDAWVERILGSMDTSGMTVISLMDCVDVVEEEIVEGMEDDGDDDDGAGGDAPAEYDEHVWTSPRNAARIVDKIADALCAADAVNAAVYRANAAAYVAEINALDVAFTELVRGAVRKTIVFGDRFPFRYFADAYGLSYFAAFPGCSTETEPSAATVAFLIDKIRAEGIPVVFHIELASEKMADTIAEATGAEKLLLHACHNLSKKDFDAGKTYVDFMRGNVEALRRALY